MSDNRENPERPQPQQEVKLDQIRNIPGGTLVRAIPTGQPARFVVTPVQSSSTLMNTTNAIQTQVIPKGTVPAAVNRLNAMQSTPTTTTGYHVPRGAAAVANIAVPRASVATPIVRAPPQLQAIGVAPPHTIAAASGSIVSRSVVNVTPWVATCLPNQANPRQQTSQLRPPPIATKLVNQRPDNQPRPVLLHSTTTKQLTLTQQGQVQVSGEKTILKSYSGANQGARMVTPVSAPPLSRISTSLPPMVSLHPAVLVPNNSSIPLKGATTAQGKVITQTTHGATAMQFTPVPVSSVQPAIAINSVVRPGLLTVMLAPGGSSTNITMSAAPAVRVPHAGKPFETTQSAFVHTQPKSQPSLIQRPLNKDDPGATTGSAMVSLSNTVYSLPGGAYYDANFQVSRPTTTSIQNLPVQSSQSSNISQGVSNQVRSVMVVDSSRNYVTAPDGGNSSSTDSSSSVSTLTLSSVSLNLTPKPNTSPRPSILRKREPEGSPMKAQKNLTPILNSMSVSAGSPPAPSSPKRPESGHSGQSSAGSTTISANSSPGESPTIKQEINDDERSTQTAPTTSQSGEMSPRKKPRKQQLTGNQMNESNFSEDEMEFISDEKIKREKDDLFEEDKIIPHRNMSLLNSYRHNWKVRNNHFMRYTDVKTREDKKATLSELASHKCTIKKLDGWKIHHLGTQIEDMSSSETEFFGLYTSLLTLLDSKPKKYKNKDFDKDIHRLSERIRANYQRSKVVKDQLNEARTQVIKLLDHRHNVAVIINRNASKRPLKKRERL